MSTPVDRLYNEATATIGALRNAGAGVSVEVSTADNLRKGLLLAAASYFESRISSTVMDFVRHSAQRAVLLPNFVRNRAVSRQYHTWFKWDDNNANQFFGLFGQEFRSMMTARVKQSDEFRDSIRAFLDLGNQRNCLVHQDYASYPLEKTLEEIYAAYNRALYFVNGLAAALGECERACRAPLTSLDIERRAYSISEARRAHGIAADPDADWYQAERELRFKDDG